MKEVDKKLILSNEEDKHIFKKKFIKKSITPKKNLCKKYFYIDKTKALNLKKFNMGNLLQLMENRDAKGDVLEQVDYVITQFEQKKKDLNKKKVDCIKSIILNNKKMPEKWIMKPNYRNLLNEAMEDDIVLNYAILCQDIHKKNNGLDQSDETRYQNFKKSKSPEKKFISYINPNSKNYLDSHFKKKLMKDYCLSIHRNNRDSLRYKFIYNNSLNGNEGKNNLYKKIEYDGSNNSIGDISKEKNKLPLIKRRSGIYSDKNNKSQNNNIIKRYNNTMDETKEELMVTSLQYTGTEIKNNNNKNEINHNNKNKLPDLPFI